MSIRTELEKLNNELPESVTLVAISKTCPEDVIMQAYDAGQRIFGENRPQELCRKQLVLPADIQWHMIGHLQTNKVRMIMPFVSLIHSADSARLLDTIDKEAARIDRTVDVLLEVFIAQDQTKHGFTMPELNEYLRSGAYRSLKNVRFRGVMSVASFTDDQELIQREFTQLKQLHEQLKADYFGTDFDTVSIGMSSDYPIAIECGSTMVRIGSNIFGSRVYN